MLLAAVLLLLAAVATALPESVIPITAVVLAQELPLGQSDELLVLVLLDPLRGDPQHSGGRLHLHTDERRLGVPGRVCEQFRDRVAGGDLDCNGPGVELKPAGRARFRLAVGELGR